jgi:methyl-accepting chemotaxis protein
MNGKLKAIIVVQINNEDINNIMQFRKGYGSTQEDYLVGKDKLMRNNSFLDPQNHSLKASFSNPLIGKVNTQASREALAGKTNTKIIIDYNGNPVLSAYKLLKINHDDISWAVLSEIDEAEVNIPVDKLKSEIFYIGLIVVISILILSILLANYISKPIAQAVQTISAGTDQIISASNEVSSSATMLAQSSTNQAASVEEISATIEQTSTTIEQTANNVREADILTTDMLHSAESGYAKVQTLLDSMKDITSSSKEIANIIKTIDEIAFQTNLLALNAAVEAARAGEHGLGFAVVADEVRNLAGKSANAAKETATIIEESLRQVETGNKIANDTYSLFEEIMNKVNKSSELVGEISLASKEQTEGINQINKAIQQIDNVTQTVASTAEQSAAASEELSAQAISMGDIISSMGAMVGYKK